MAIPSTAFEDTWRVRCPEGHANLRRQEYAATAYCYSCRRSYPFEELVDTKEQGGVRDSL